MSGARPPAGFQPRFVACRNVDKLLERQSLSRWETNRGSTQRTKLAFVLCSRYFRGPASWGSRFDSGLGNLAWKEDWVSCNGQEGVRAGSWAGQDLQEWGKLKVEKETVSGVEGKDSSLQLRGCMQGKGQGEAGRRRGKV